MKQTMQTAARGQMMTDPFAKFADWFAAATAAEPADPNACALATIEITPAGPRPDVRVVLMKEYDLDGFVFYTNFESAKSRQMIASPMAALDFHWKSLKRQVRMAGSVHKVATTMSDTYFATRPRESQLSAWASRQSEPLADRAEFEVALATMDKRFPGAIPRPPFWGGWRLVPDWIEFWEDRIGRQHHRERFTRVHGADPHTPTWRSGLIYP